MKKDAMRMALMNRRAKSLSLDDVHSGGGAAPMNELLEAHDEGESPMHEHEEKMMKTEGEDEHEGDTDLAPELDDSETEKGEEGLLMDHEAHPSAEDHVHQSPELNKVRSEVGAMHGKGASPMVNPVRHALEGGGYAPPQSLKGKVLSAMKNQK